MSRRLLPLLATLVVLAGVLPGSAAAESFRSRAVTWAVTQVGQHEVNHTNCSVRINAWERAMGLRLPPCRPWCGAIVHQAFLRQGVRLSARLIDPNRSLADARARRRHLHLIPKSSVRRGDLLFFKFRPGVAASHLAMVRAAPKHGVATTVEGNVSDHVVLRRRGLRYAVAAARVVAS